MLGVFGELCKDEGACDDRHWRFAALMADMWNLASFF